jgi:hypothetical protein
MTSTPIGTPYIARAADPAPLASPPALAASSAGWFTPTLLAFAAVCLGQALQVNFGQYHPIAIRWLTLALGAALAAVALPNFGRLVIAGWRPDQVVLAVGLAVQFSMLWASAPAATLKPGSADELAPFKAGVALAAALVAVGVSQTRVAKVAVPLVLLAHLLLGVWIIHATPAPAVDVYVFQRDAADALLRGENPYAITFPDIYGHHAQPVYGEGIAQNGRLNFGYPYLPLSLFLTIPGHVLGGDFRYAHLVALTLAGALIAYARPVGKSIPSARAVAAAAVLLFTPRGFFVIEAGWIEPVAILMLAAVVFCACRRGRMWGIALAISLGLLLASKQYLVLALPLVLLIPTDRFDLPRHLIASIALLVAVAVTLPLASWNPDAFIRSAVTLQFHQPFRTDSLSYLVPLSHADGPTVPVWIAFPCAGVAGLLALWRCPRTPSGFAIGVAVVFFAFFATSKQAFCNYYAFVLAGLCCALAALPGQPPAPARRPAAAL